MRVIGTGTTDSRQITNQRTCPYDSSDTMGAITGAIAGAYYHQMPASLYEFGINKLPEDIKDIINKFDQEHGHMVSYKWYNPEFPKEEFVRKVRSVEIFI